jgi:hypothetical protein
MARSNTTFQPGQSGNPKGRPPKERALTELLKNVGNKTIEIDGQRITRKKYVASLVWELLATGKATLADGRIFQAELADWLSLVKFLYGQVDGPPRLEVEHGGDVTQTVTVKLLRGVKMDDL